MNRTVVYVFTASLLLLVGCSVDHREVTDANTTDDGHIIIYEWTTNVQKQAVLKDGYGLMIFYNVFEKNPVIRFKLYVHDTKKLVQISDINQFKRELANISSGQTLHYYNTCGPGTHHAMDRGVIEEIKACCIKRGIIFQKGDNELFSICTCL